ncbi:phage tail protein [Burkholderia sp. ABCPW 14]|uniref:phage tail protein n=1 Tax=Burkholderia sp. ABCPW 14 TaxID=1637860 RepID=UPI000770E14D|nr:phage tail protein [Burkholderia sp. ABCPW 14]KVD76786.1 phage tail protein [Burkholderia sp. ABCPW 14]
MSAPDDSNSKAPPSLLSSHAGKESGANNSRILANLEGRVSPQPENAPRSRKGPLALVALAVVAVAGWGAWRLQQPSTEHADVTAAASAPAVAAAPVSNAVPASAAQIAQASAPQPATIVNDDSAASDAKPAVAASAGGEGRLSRALANGASDVSPTEAAAGASVAAAAVAAAKPAKRVEKGATKSVAAKQDAAHAKTQAAARKRHDKTQATETAQAKKRRETSAKKNGKDDPDADLLAALVARTKPATPADAAKTNANTASKKAAAAASASADTSLAARVKACGERGFFEDQLCRWRVCENHWGKDPACPTSATQNRQP